MKPLLLCILDGVGINKEEYGNAVKHAYMPNFNYMLKNYANSLLEASGELVGLPSGQMGNSEVGHTNIGAGRIVYQPLQLINEKIKDGSFYQNVEILNTIEHVKKNNSTLHLLGLVSDGGIHSHLKHLLALIDLVKESGVKQVYIHCFLDGRDTLPQVAIKYLDVLNEKLQSSQNGKIATLSGRYYAMDRDNRWDRVAKAYEAIVNGQGEIYADYQTAIASNYNRGINDEFIIPCVIDRQGMIKDNDGLICFNFRPDRLRELFSVLTNATVKPFEHVKRHNLKLVTMFPVSDEVVCTNAFKIDKLNNTLGEYIADRHLRQLRIAETEKYAHVTYFFDGGIEKQLEGCTRILIPSPKVATYDLKPEMSAYEITDKLLEEIEMERYDFIVLNFANGDMVGHTGDFNATVKALEAVDICLGKILRKMNDKKGIMIVTADHGNSDFMLDAKGQIITSHSTNKVPFIINCNNCHLKDGKLADIAPTILKLMNLPIPDEMTGNVLIGE
ncbi:MAG: 2,3-bisphosphoglycerate-independent phosphoglycerate mutase [Bacilli bacterium]